MARFRIMTEQAVYTPFFKVFEAPTMEEAERMAEIQVEGLTMQQTLAGNGWEAGDSSTEYEVKLDVTACAIPRSGGVPAARNSATARTRMDTRPAATRGQVR